MELQPQKKMMKSCQVPNQIVFRQHILLYKSTCHPLSVLCFTFPFTGLRNRFLPECPWVCIWFLSTEKPNKYGLLFEALKVIYRLYINIWWLKKFEYKIDLISSHIETKVRVSLASALTYFPVKWNIWVVYSYKRDLNLILHIWLEC